MIDKERNIFVSRKAFLFCRSLLWTRRRIFEIVREQLEKTWKLVSIELSIRDGSKASTILRMFVNKREINYRRYFVDGSTRFR